MHLDPALDRVAKENFKRAQIIYVEKLSNTTSVYVIEFKGVQMMEKSKGFGMMKVANSRQKKLDQFQLNISYHEESSP